MFMKFNIEVELDSYDSINDLEEEIIHKVATVIINEQMNNYSKDCGKTFRDKLKKETQDLIINTMDKDFKQEVTDGIIEEFIKKYERTKQAREIKQQFDIESDKEIKDGLKGVVAELVNQELKKRFK